MKKLLIAAMALSLALSAAPAFAKGKAKAKKAAAKTWQCDVGGNVVMTGTVEECMKQGGTVANYPGPDMPLRPRPKRPRKPKRSSRRTVFEGKNAAGPP